MSRLTPEKRQDKNGRIVTRHVKPMTASAGKALPSPLPVTASTLTNEEKQLAAARRIMRSLFTQTSGDTYDAPDGNSYSFDDINKLLAMITYDSLDAISDKVDSLSAHERDIVSYTLSEVSRRFGSLMNNLTLPEGMLHYSAELAPVAAKFSDDSKSPMELHIAIMNLNMEIEMRFRGKDVRLVSASEGEKAVVRGAAAMSFLTGEPVQSMRLPEMSWIGGNLGRIEGYKGLIRAHGAMDRAFVEGLMSTDAPSLAGGYL
jgi:hypothetical protein